MSASGLASSGDRPLGLQTAQLLAVASWLRTTAGAGRIAVVTDGIRNRLIALSAAAFQPGVFAGIEGHASIESLDDVLKRGVPFRSAPEVFCLDLYKYFDLERLSVMAEPTEVKPTAKEEANGNTEN